VISGFPSESTHSMLTSRRRNRRVTMQPSLSPGLSWRKRLSLVFLKQPTAAQQACGPFGLTAWLFRGDALDFDHEAFVDEFWHDDKCRSRPVRTQES
jgi:hypothetical protein